MTQSPGPSAVTTPIRAVIFDLFHTLIDMSMLPPGQSTPDLLGIDAATWAQKVIEASPHHALGSVRDAYESVRLIAHAIDPGLPEEKIRYAVQRRPARFRAALTQVRPQILEGIRRMRAGGLKIGLISNAAFDEVEAWEDSPLAPLFDAYLVSCHEGVMKPDLEIYHRAAQRLGVRPEACLYVGDGGSREHEGARGAGMKTVLFLGLLRANYPDLAQRRPRNTDWEFDDFDEVVRLAERLAKRRSD